MQALEQRNAELEAQVVAAVGQHAAVSDQRISALLAVCSAILVTHDVDTILQLVVRDCAALFPGCSAALLFMTERDQQRLRLRAASTGPSKELILTPGQGLAGRAYLAPRAMLIAGDELTHAVSELDPMQHAEATRLVEPWPPTSALAAPLRSGTQRLGALVIYGGPAPHVFPPRDLQFVQALADLAAVAVDERMQLLRTAALQRDLTQSRSIAAAAQAQLDAAQAQLLQSAKLAAVGELAASVAHEINNPLYAARNSLYLVEQDLAEALPQRAFLQIAQAELGRIARIITRMRDFYRPTRDEREPTDVNVLLSETLELVQTHLRHGRVEIAPRFAEYVPVLTANPDQLRQVFLNLMLNACDAMPDGGVLTVSTRVLREDADSSGAIVVAICDTGVGVPLEHRAHLFEPFYTTKPNGTGLGLAISAHIVAQHGGTIELESTVGEGTTFKVTLPFPVAYR